MKTACMGDLRGFLVERAMILILILRLSGLEIMIGQIYLRLRITE